MSVPNQIIIQEFKYEPCNKENIYATINIEALQHAMIDLTSMNTLKLWLYLSKNSHSFSHLELSSADCIKNWGLGKSQWSKTKDDLVAKGYLVPLREDKKTTWYKFIQNPETGNEELNGNEEDFPETGILLVDEIPETGLENQELKDDGIPETGKISYGQIPETGNCGSETGQNSPESVGEILHNIIDNTILENAIECKEYKVEFAINQLGCKKIGEDKNWIYVKSANNTNLKFRKEIRNEK